MAIVIRLDRVLADRKMQLGELANEVGVTNVNLSNLKTGKVRAIRFSTLESIKMSARRYFRTHRGLNIYKEDVE